MKLLVTLVSFSFCLLLNAQTVPYHSIIDTTLTWQTNNYFTPQMHGFVQWDNRLSFNGQDTIIDGKSYHILSRTIDFRGDQTDKLFIRDTLDRRYYLLTSQGNVLLYDFSAEVGDTLWYSSGSAFYYVINTIDTILINGGLHRQFEAYTNWIFPNSQPGTLWWIEGIGNSAWGILSNSSIDLGFGYSFCWLEKNGNVIYPDLPRNCNFGTTGLTSIESGNLSIYPNPTTSKLFIDYHKPVDLGIYDVNGKMVMTSLPNTGEIDLSDLSAGIYFVQIRTSKGTVARKKIIKSE